MSLMTISSPSCPTTVPPRTTSRSQTANVVIRSRSSSLRKARTLVSEVYGHHDHERRLINFTDVIVLTAMGEETAIDCKEAAK